MTAREMVRNYKEVMTYVDETHDPIIITAGNLQVAIISMDDLRAIQDLKYKNSAKDLIQLASEARNLLKDSPLPSDLSVNHDYYLLEDE